MQRRLEESLMIRMRPRRDLLRVEGFPGNAEGHRRPQKVNEIETQTNPLG